MTQTILDLGAPLGFLLLLAGALLALAAYFTHGKRWPRRVAATSHTLLAILALTFGGYWTWFTHRSQPAPTHEEWFQGVHYERIVRQEPRLMVAHVVRIDLHEPGIELVLSPPATTGDTPYLACTVSEFARQSDCQVAVNACFFTPFYADNPCSYYPRSGDPVQVIGYSAYNGQVYHAVPAVATLFIAADGRPSFDAPIGPLHHAFSGDRFLVRDGVVLMKRPYPELAAHSALGFDQSGHTLFLVMIDGKQPGYSEGATFPELAEFLQSIGLYNAINLDGGGSGTLVRRTGTKTELINCTSNFRIPWWQRPVANQLGIKARPLP